ncbi:ATP-binding protein [Spongiivirga sp. MCCC 1A20706]|uniref:sensor histidine kinase n=1 Tax=Spongiivirga sp. MCCC 1A20706 TaxID=3160963 RepID=UPI0039779D1A
MTLRTTLQPAHGIVHNTAIWKEKITDVPSTWNSIFCFLNIDFEGIDDLPAYFFTHVIHPGDSDHLEELLNAFFTKQERFIYKVRLLLNDSLFELYEFKGSAELVESGYELTLQVKQTDTAKRKVHDPNESDFFYKETANMTLTGGWMVDADTLEVFWDRQTKKIYGVAPHYQPKFQDVLSFYIDDHRDMLYGAFRKCLTEGIHYDMELQLRGLNGETTWIRTKGKPVYDKSHQIIKARGIIQNIDRQKRKEIKLKESFDIILKQNERLYNFAHIVSHNLRSHSGNFELILGLLNDPDTSKKDKKEYVENLQLVSQSLNETISHLNEVVNMHVRQDEKVRVYFEDTLTNVKNGIQQIIEKNNTKIITNFEVKAVDHIPAYLDSILLNLLTNAIRYRHPERNPEIMISTFKENDKTILSICDNGLGIDLIKNEHKIFGMYKTFHGNDDARGMGLFMTKSQVEALNGTIEVSSEPDKGSTFKITF